MSKPSSLPQYDVLSDALETLQASLDAAQTHGLLCGVICSGLNLEPETLMAAILRELELPEGASAAQLSQAQDILLALYRQSIDMLQEIDLSFSLVLPNDSVVLNHRIQALGKWCQGFLYGLGMAGEKINLDADEQVREAILHLSEIAKIADAEMPDEPLEDNDETDYAQIFEYVCLGVLYIYSAFNPRPPLSVETMQTPQQYH